MHVSFTGSLQLRRCTLPCGGRGTDLSAQNLSLTHCPGEPNCRQPSGNKMRIAFSDRIVTNLYATCVTENFVTQLFWTLGDKLFQRSRSQDRRDSVAVAMIRCSSPVSHLKWFRCLLLPVTKHHESSRNLESVETMVKDQGSPDPAHGEILFEALTLFAAVLHAWIPIPNFQ